MAGFDGTGPRGMGQRTGGGRGGCAPGPDAAYSYGSGTYRGAGRGGKPWGGGRGRAWGGSRGRGRNGYAGGGAGTQYGAGDSSAGRDVRLEMEFLKNQATAMAQEIEQISTRIDELSVRESQPE